MAAVTLDVGLNENGDLPAFTRHISGIDLVMQRVNVRLRTFYGEWILDRKKGLPFFTWAAQKPPDVDGIGAVVRREIEGTPGVVRVDDWEGEFDAEAASLSYTCTVRTTDGDAEVRIQPFGNSDNRNPSIMAVIRQGRVAPG
jgi:hypothetical protein